MRLSIVARGWLLALALTACRKADSRSASPAKTGVAQASSTVSARGDVVDALEAQPDPCRWLTNDEVTAALGPMQPTTQRVTNVGNLDPDPKGTACLYQLAPKSSGAAGPRITVAVDPTGNVAVEGAAKIVNARIAKDAPGTLEMDTAKAAGGWDASVWNIDVYHARLGSLAVEVGTPDWQVAKIDREKVERLAALVRDKVPDKPFAAPRHSGSADGDACSLITRQEVEQIVGAPVPLAPFHSLEGDPLADEYGSSCSYWLGRHRALTISAEWSDGTQLFKATTMMGNIVDQRLGLTGESADTLDGNWDQVASAAGALVFLKGDKMLSVSHVRAAITTAAAVRVAATAMARLVEQK